MRYDVSITGLENIRKYTDPSVYRKASRRTVSRLGSKFKTHASKEVRKEYNITAKRLKSAIRTQFKFTQSNGYQYRFYVSGKTINMIHFGARTLKRGGVSVKSVKRGGGRIKLRHAFIANDRGGRARVFERVGVARLPLRSVTTLSVPQMFNDRIVRGGLELVKRTFASEMEHNIQFYAGKVK